MQLAFISSIRFLELCNEGDIEMALAPLVLQSESYADRYAQVAEDGRFVILDNGAFEMQELGQGVDADTLYRCARRINATEVICPDVLYDGPATNEATEAFIQDMLRIADPEWLDRTSFMVVPQGGDADEWLDCAHRLASIDGVRLTVGLSKLSVPRCFGGPLIVGRSKALEALLDTDWRHFMDDDVPFVHLLGGDFTLPLELQRHSQSSVVRSNDSSFAYWYPKNLASLNEYDLPVDTASQRIAYLRDRPDLHAEVAPRIKVACFNMAAKLKELACA